MTSKSAFPTRKISETFLEFAKPLMEAELVPPTLEEAEAILMFAFVAWNAVVYDTVNGNTEWVTKVRSPVAGKPEVLKIIDNLIQRKKELYGGDLRLVGKYKLRLRRDSWHLRAEARSPY